MADIFSSLFGLGESEREKNQKEIDYEAGQHEALKGGIFSDIGHIIEGPLKSDQYNDGYKWGLEHRREYQTARERESQRQEDSTEEDSSSSDSSSDYDSSPSYSPSVTSPPSKQFHPKPKSLESKVSKRKSKEERRDEAQETIDYGRISYSSDGSKVYYTRYFNGNEEIDCEDMTEEEIIKLQRSSKVTRIHEVEISVRRG